MSTNATLGQGGHILTLIDQKGVSKEQLTDVITSGILPDFLEAVAVGLTKTREETRVFFGLGPLELRITVDYGLSLEQMIAAGHYNWVNSDITAERFPIKGEGKKELSVDVIHFNRDISSENAVAEIGKMGLRPATIEELLAFGATFPEMQRKFPVVALGSSCEVFGYRNVPYLGRDGSKRNLFLLNWWVDDWHGRYRFLAVRK